MDVVVNRWFNGGGCFVTRPRSAAVHITKHDRRKISTSKETGCNGTAVVFFSVSTVLNGITVGIIVKCVRVPVW